MRSFSQALDSSGAGKLVDKAEQPWRFAEYSIVERRSTIEVHTSITFGTGKKKKKVLSHLGASLPGGNVGLDEYVPCALHFWA